MLNNKGLKTVSFNDLKKTKIINTKNDPIMGALLTDLSSDANVNRLHSKHYSLTSDEIATILEIIDALSLCITDSKAYDSIPEHIKPYIDALKSLYLKSNMSSDMDLMASPLTASENIFNLF